MAVLILMQGHVKQGNKQRKGQQSSLTPADAKYPAGNARQWSGGDGMGWMGRGIDDGHGRILVNFPMFGCLEGGAGWGFTGVLFPSGPQ